MMSNGIQKTEEKREFPVEQEYKFDVFISHASEDKDDIARPLAKMLKEFELRVWYDEFELNMGDNLKQKIQDGLDKSRFGIVILSKSFFNKDWPRRELNKLEERENLINRGIILPIWHKVTKQEVTDFSPSLADKLALNTTTHTIEEISQKIAELIQGKRPENWYQFIFKLFIWFEKVVSNLFVNVKRK